MSRPEFRCRRDLWTAFTAQAAADGFTATRAMETLLAGYVAGTLDPGAPTPFIRGLTRNRVNLDIDRTVYDPADTLGAAQGWRSMTPLAEALITLYTEGHVTFRITAVPTAA